MSLKYLRQCRLVVSDNDGNSEDLSVLRVSFKITHGIQTTPRVLAARVYNPAPATIVACKHMYQQVTLAVGYGDRTQEIFVGKIWQTRDGRESPTDSFLDIFATTGEEAFTFGTVSTTLNEGWTHQDVHETIAKSMSADNVKAGTLPKVRGTGARPKVLYGMSRDHARSLSVSTNSVGGIDGNELHYISVQDIGRPKDNDTVLVISPQTGLIGTPVQTQDGINFKCLIDPKIRVNSTVRLEDVKVLDAQADPNVASTNNGNLIGGYDGTQASVLGLSPTGTYSVIWVEHEGDTRGNPWYSSVNCYAVDVSAVPSSDTVNKGF